MTAAWEPGPPSLRALAPAVLAGAIAPLVAYQLVRPHVDRDATALIIAGVLPAGWVALGWARHRRLDPIGSMVLMGFVIGVVGSVALGGNALVLKMRESSLTVSLGLGCLASLRARRPAMFYVGRALSAGNDPERRRAFDELWESPAAPRTFAVITATWGVGILLEASLRLLLALAVSTQLFLVLSPLLFAGFVGTLLAGTVGYVRRVRRTALELVER